MTDPKTRFRYIYLTPITAQRALLRFDQGVEVEPFEFRLGLNGSQMVPSRERGLRKRKTPKQMAAFNKMQAAKKARVVVDRVDRKNGRSRTRKIGGKAPPTAVLTGNRRQFGIKAAGNLY